MKNKKILIIDDDPEFVSELAELLEAEGYEADTAVDGAAGLELAAGKDYLAVILDYKLQGLTGLETLRRMNWRGPGAAVVMVSGRPEVAELLKNEAVLARVVCVLEKPFDPGLLLKKLRGLDA